MFNPLHYPPICGAHVNFPLIPTKAGFVGVQPVLVTLGPMLRRPHVLILRCCHLGILNNFRTKGFALGPANYEAGPDPKNVRSNASGDSCLFCL